MLLFSTINDIQLRFATPIMVRAWPDASKYNEAIKQIIMRRYHESEGVQLSNCGGWQSTDDYFSWGGEGAVALSQWVTKSIFSIHHTYHQQKFLDFVKKAGADFSSRISGWANLNHAGDYNDIHNHPNCHWSGVYYVKTPEGAGSLACFDPRSGTNMLGTGNEVLDLFSAGAQLIEPKEGFAVIFPSWLMHRVMQNTSGEDRISIAFNFRFLTGQSASASTHTSP